MRFLVDESTGPAVAIWLRTEGHDVLSVFEVMRGADDEVVLHAAYAENRILITNDKDFGEKVYRERRPHKGIVLLRLDDERTSSKINILRRLLAQHADQLTENFIVATETRVRLARL
jgi:predicted nuclease of predicted toxin-antitoxin system